jgi:2-oxoglutarate dehydrogenase E1 component
MPPMEPFPDATSLAFLEERYAEFLRDPDTVPESLRTWFERFGSDPDTAPRAPSFRPSSVFSPAGASGNGRAVADIVVLQDRVDQLVRAYRVRGHLLAELDPLRRPRPPCRELDSDYYGFRDSDLETRFSTNTIHGPENLTLAQIIERLRSTYCRRIGVQFMHIDDLHVKGWLTARMEGTENRIELSRKQQLRILRRLTDAVIFEEFVRKKFLGAKSFSLEGAESLIPLLDLMIEKAVDDGTRLIEIGMAHRGRLNVLRNILHKGPREIFREFDDPDPERYLGTGDVKYHKGWDSDWVTGGGNSARIALCFNPSHLEFVNPVALGRMRAKMDRAGDDRHREGLTILIHGDAAFAGEGIVQETLNMSQLPGYATGGTLHVILNNQIGFTTCPEQSRSTTYATDVAKMLQIPIFHVNGEDPEAVAQVVSLAVDFRRAFQRDVVIDMYAYRRLGHNEGDEPAFTQPLMYRDIRQRKTTRQGYLERLRAIGEVTEQEAAEIEDRLQKLLERELEASRSQAYEHPEEQPLLGVWTGYFGGPEKFAEEVETTFERDRLAGLLRSLSVVPEDFRPHEKIRRWLDQRAEMADGKRPLDWSAAEALALATLAVEGHRIRITGQDSERGTFSHRHAVLHDFEDGRTHMPLRHLSPDQAPVEIVNSPCPRPACSGSSTATAWSARAGWWCGRRSSATSRTRRR